MTTLEQWTVWKQKCALGLCPADIQNALRDFAHARFYKFACAYSKETNMSNPQALTPEPPEAWNRFESSLCIRDTREGKCYKEWLFADYGSGSDSPVAGIEAGATVLIRDVVREYIRQEFSTRWMAALDAPVKGDNNEHTISLHELLPGSTDTTQEVERRELEHMAEKEAVEAMKTLSHRERMALLAREMGLSLAHPAVTAAAGCGKSVLNTAYHDALHSLAGFVRAKYPQEDRSAMAILTIMIFERAKKLILLWGKSENVCAELCMLVKGEER